MVQRKPTREARNAREAQLVALREAQARAERRHRILVVGVAGAIIATLVLVAGLVISNEARKRDAVSAAAELPITGVTDTKGLSANHVATTPAPAPTAATALPPVGGDHDAVPQNCGVYTEPVISANAVHSLEHGAVWITYRPGLAADQVDQLTQLTRSEPYTLLSPFPELAAPVVLTAWGEQLEVDDATDPRVATFVAKYAQGEQAPEPGAACSGGVGNPS